MPQQDSLTKLQRLLRNIFQFDLAELDFGIYRILNQRRGRIEKFLTEELPEAVDAEFGKAEAEERQRLEEELEELIDEARETAGEKNVKADGTIAESARSVRVVDGLAKQIEAKKHELEGVQVSEAARAQVFNHLYNFFSRYYEDGESETILVEVLKETISGPGIAD